MMPPKNPLKSKRFWFTVFFALFNTLMTFFPAVKALVENNPEIYSWILTTIFGYVGVRTVKPLKLPFGVPKE